MRRDVAHLEMTSPGSGCERRQSPPLKFARPRSRRLYRPFALHGSDARRWEIKRLRYRPPSVAGRVARTGHRTVLHLPTGTARPSYSSPASSGYKLCPVPA